MPAGRYTIPLLSFLLTSLPAATAQPLPATEWSGEIRIMGMNLGIRVHFVTRGDSLAATIDIPMQNAFGLPLTRVRWIPPECSFDLPAGPGLASFRGTASGDSIAGPFTQAGMKGDFVLRPALPEKPVPATPLPYSEQDVTFASDDAILAGTLTIPEGPPPFPAAILISGSGPQNRDEQIFDFAPFRVIADHLARKGIAVLRYDDRGDGKSTGSFPLATTRTFAADAQAAFAFLRKEKRIAPGKIGLIGHSEGGIAAAIVASRDRNIAYLVLLASPAVRGDSLINYQVEGAVRRAGKSDQEIGRVLQLQREIYGAVRRGTGFERIEELLMAEGRASLLALTEAQRGAVPDSIIRDRVQTQLSSIRSDWFRVFITMDPAEALRRVSSPVLALFGETDQQVPPSLNEGPTTFALRAAGNNDVTIRVFPETNHLFLRSTTGDPAEYASLTKTFVPGFLDLVSGWIRKRFVR